jgi:superfamily II DNA or RNA helicase
MPDMKGIHSVAGDFVRSEIEQVMSGKAVIGDCVSHYKSKAMGKKALLFGVSVRHSEVLAEQFNQAGIPAMHIDANTPDAWRRKYISDFADGRIMVLCNVDLFGEGFDLSSIAGRDVPIEAVIQMRPTQSLSLHLQQIGRALRPKPYPAIILDHAGNIVRHGLPDSKYEWSLEPRAKKRRGAGGDERARQCPECYFVHEPHLLKCPNCAYEYAPAGRELDEVEGNLEEINKEQLKRKRAWQQAQAQSLDDLIRLGYSRGYQPGKCERWAAFVYTARKRKRADSQRSYHSDAG